MIKPTLSLVSLTTSSLLLFAACDSSPEATNPSLAEVPGGGSCNVQLSYLGPKVLVVNRFTTNNNASWHIANNGSSGVTLRGQTLSKSGKVTAVRPNVWAPFPYTLPPGTMIDADLRFDVGGAGTGSVGMTVSSSCGSLVLPTHPVSVQ